MRRITEEAGIIDRLSSDELYYIDTFMTLPDFFYWSLANKHLSLFMTDEEAIVWKNDYWLSYYTGLNMSHDKKLIDKYFNKYKAYKSIIREFIRIRYDVAILGDDRDEKYIFEHRYRSVARAPPARMEWYSLKTTLALHSGQVHEWEIVLDDFPEVRNAFKLFIGLCTESTYVEFLRDGPCCIVGYRQNTGYSLNVGEWKMHAGSHKGSVIVRSAAWKRVHKYNVVAVKSGDVFTCKLDILGSKYRYISDWNADWSIYLNGTLLTSTVVDVRNGPFYPIISAYGNPVITVRPSAMNWQ